MRQVKHKAPLCLGDVTSLFLFPSTQPNTQYTMLSILSNNAYTFMLLHSSFWMEINE